MSFLNFGIFKQIEEGERLTRLRAQFNTANKLCKTECQKCGFCCYKRTCIPTPIEFVEIAKYLNLTVIETIKKYYCVDGDDPYYIKPAGINQLDILGEYIPSERTYNEGKCVFLDDRDQCKIYLVRPLSAKIMECWNNDNEKENEIKHKLILESWNNNKLKEIYPEFNENNNSEDYNDGEWD